MRLNYRVTVDVVVEIDETGAVFNAAEGDDRFAIEQKKHGRALFDELIRSGEFEPIVRGQALCNLREGSMPSVDDPSHDMADVAALLPGDAGKFFREAIVGAPYTEENIEAGCVGSVFPESADEVFEALFDGIEVMKVGIEKLDPPK